MRQHAQRTRSNGSTGAAVAVRSSLRTHSIALGMLASFPVMAEAADRSAFFLTHASSVEERCLEVDTRSLPFSCHRVSDGEQTVVAVRDFKRTWNADRSSFSKLTVVLPESPRVGQVFTIGEQGVRAFFSNGASAFAGKSGCYSTAATGEVTVDAVERHRVEVSLRATFTLASPLDWPGDCNVPVSIHRAIKAGSANITELGAWEGRPHAGDSPFVEAHPSKRQLEPG